MNNNEDFHFYVSLKIANGDFNVKLELTHAAAA